MEDGDIIDINVSYRVKPFAGVMGFDGFAMAQRYYGKAWTDTMSHSMSATWSRRILWYMLPKPGRYIIGTEIVLI